MPEKVIVEAVSKLAKSSEDSYEMLEEHEQLVITHIGLLDEMIRDLTDHHTAHDKCINFLSKNPSSPPPLQLQGSYHQGKWEYDPTHDALAIAADREDAARITMLRCLKATQERAPRSERRKSAVQIAVRSARSKQHKNWVAGKFGNFGSSDARVTDPAKRKVHHTPESTPDHQWPVECLSRAARHTCPAGGTRDACRRARRRKAREVGSRRCPCCRSQTAGISCELCSPSLSTGAAGEGGGSGSICTVGADSRTFMTAIPSLRP